MFEFDFWNLVKILDCIKSNIIGVVLNQYTVYDSQILKDDKLKLQITIDTQYNTYLE